MKLNMTVLKPSRKVIKPGDVFCFRLKHEDFFRYGRVIKTDTSIGGFKDIVILIYLYKATSRKKTDIPSLNKDDLLIPPIGTNKLPWTKGYFETIEHRSLVPEDAFQVHHFVDHLRGVYYDEKWNDVQTPNEPIGEWGVHSFGTIDNAISDALGIPWAEELPEDFKRALEGKPNPYRK